MLIDCSSLADSSLLDYMKYVVLTDESGIVVLYYVCYSWMYEKNALNNFDCLGFRARESIYGPY